MPGRAVPVPVQRGLVDSPFFRSKFRVPAAPQHFVHRARLTELLDDLAAYPVTAVVAPAGAGKTALAADWIRGSDLAVRLAGHRRVGPRPCAALRRDHLGRGAARPGCRATGRWGS